MSHSQFHRINWFILGHAWLNLWDKHMTTGRINQVSTFSRRAVLSGEILCRAQPSPFQGTHTPRQTIIGLVFRVKRTNVHHQLECTIAGSL